jgi:hypothetical protein
LAPQAELTLPHDKGGEARDLIDPRFETSDAGSSE